MASKKKITFISLNFYPEDTAIGLYSSQLVEYLTQNGFEVDVITGFPYYPQWKIAEKYRDKPRFYTEKYKSAQIYRYKQYVPEKPRFLKRILHLLDFTIGSYINSRKIKETDLVINIVPFIGAVKVGNYLAKRKKAKHWVHIQDFEFDAAYQTDLTKNKKFIFDFLFWIEKKLLNKADVVSTISYTMLKKLQSKVDPQKETYFLPNWVDLSVFNPENCRPHKYMKPGKYKILYSGNIGEKQDWDLFLKVAGNIEDQDIQFIIVGNGAKKDWLVQQIKNYKNIAYYPPVPYEELPDLLCSADLHILFQKNNVIDTVMPSKILGMMASGKPSLITGNLKSEVAIIMEQAKAGLYLQPKDHEEVIQSIYHFKNNPNNTYGNNAREYVAAHFSSDNILENLKEKINRVLET
jgi:colanic acid biosynthesis glycosyl transferase WcaI